MLDELDARLEALKQELASELAAAVVSEVRKLAVELRASGPDAVTRQEACARLSVGMTKLKGMISRGDIATCIGDPHLIPISEIQRFTRPATPAAKRRSGGRRPKEQFNAKAEAAAGRLEAKARRR